MSVRARVAVSFMALSAMAFVGLTQSEHYVEKAMIPTKGDRPTLGYGSTFHPDGRPVKLGESTTPVRALVIAMAHINKDEKLFRESLKGASLHQAEFDIYMDWVYQYGTSAWSNSSMKREILAGNYKDACKALLLYKRSAGYDCSTLINGKPNKVCYGVWTRQVERYNACMGVQ